MIDPLRDRIDRYIALLAYYGCKLEMIFDTHTHADHRSGAIELGDLRRAGRDASAIADPAREGVCRRRPALHRRCIGLQTFFTPGHTPDSIIIYAGDRVFTGDVLLIHGTGRCDFAGGDPGDSYDSITQKIFTLPDKTLVFPAHDYRGHTQSTVGEEKRGNPRLAGRTRQAYVDLMNNLGLPLPDGIQESLQPNQSEIDGATISFPNLAQLNQVRQLDAREVAARIAGPNPPLLLDVREEEEPRGELGHIADARLVPLRELSEQVKELEAFKDRDIIAISGSASAAPPRLRC